MALLALAFMCPAMLPTFCADGRQTCPSPTCYLLALAPSIPVLVMAALLLWIAHFPLPHEYPLLVFRPPRPFLL